MISLLLLTACKKENKIVVAEVTHSIFYAPQYVALNEKIFEKNGLNIEIILTSGADKVMAALISKEAQIGLMGPEASIYVYKEGRIDYPITFVQLTNTDGSFIVGREKIENFSFAHLKNKSILGGRVGGMPEMVLEYILRKNDIEFAKNSDSKDVNIRTDISFQAMSGAFIAGEGDFVSLFEPTATEVELNGYGYVLTSLGEHIDNVAYTCYSTLNSYFSKKQGIIEAFANSIDEAIKWVYNHTDKEVAEAIKPYFIETDINI